MQLLYFPWTNQAPAGYKTPCCEVIFVNLGFYVASCYYSLYLPASENERKSYCVLMQTPYGRRSVLNKLPNICFGKQITVNYWLFSNLWFRICCFLNYSLNVKSTDEIRLLFYLDLIGSILPYVIQITIVCCSLLALLHVKVNFEMKKVLHSL